MVFFIYKCFDCFDYKSMPSFIHDLALCREMSVEALILSGGPPRRVYVGLIGIEMIEHRAIHESFMTLLNRSIWGGCSSQTPRRYVINGTDQ